MHPYALSQLNQLEQEFKALKKYTDKLSFFDTHFGLIPFEPPLFEHELESLLQNDTKNTFVAIFLTERKKPIDLVKSFTVKNQKFVFKVAPNNLTRQVFNQYVLDKFLNNDYKFYQEIKTIDNLAALGNKETLLEALKKAKELLSSIKLQKNNRIRGSYRNQFINVFNTGYEDYCSKITKTFPLKKKIIELYLYAQGVLFAKYVTQLINATSDNDTKANLYIQENPILKNIHLLKETGILQFLIGYKQMQTDKVADLFCDLVGGCSIELKKQVNAHIQTLLINR